jgi:arginine decarboxylase
MENWNTAASSELYRIEGWGKGYFKISENGHVAVSPGRDDQWVDLHSIVEDLVRRGVQAPHLIRFDGIIRERAKQIQEAFKKAMDECDYSGNYTLTYPVKVNQQRQVIESVKRCSNGTSIGLEVGSKPELLAVLAMHDNSEKEALLLCNGYKDAQLIELALLSKKLGLRPIIIVEQFYELDTILKAAQEVGVEAEIGLRMNPAYKGAGRWAGSAGENAKFGLTPFEIVEAVKLLKQHGKEDWIKLLHFHMGSQITAISAIKRVMKEATRMYAELAKMCPSICFLDVGGGLGVDYDGSSTNFESSMNYSLEQYARDVVWELKQMCEECDLPQPNIISESGRALVAHHAVLVTEVMDVAQVGEPPAELDPAPSDNEKLAELAGLYKDLNLKNIHEVFNDALGLREEFLNNFVAGNLSLEERAYAERSIRFLFTKINILKDSLKVVPEDLEALEGMLKDMYFCNFSVFQSLLDSWAIDQLFPIMPIHRLEQKPDRKAVIADLTCDSDGKIDRFIDLREVKRYVNLHPFLTDQPYYLGVFLVGAYQECLGNLHNLFGDTNAVHVEVDEGGIARIKSIVEGDTISEVLNYVQYTGDDLISRINNSIEIARQKNGLCAEEAAGLMRRYKESLSGYTYLLWEQSKI